MGTIILVEGRRMEGRDGKERKSTDAKARLKN